MKTTALSLPGEHRIQVPHFAPMAIDKYVYQYQGSSLPLDVDGSSGSLLSRH